MRFECASRTNVGLKRKINEDSILAETGRGLWVVADGMGGHEAGEIASNMVTDALRCLPDIADLDALADLAVDALRQVNGELIDLARSGDRQQTIGTTVVGLRSPTTPTAASGSATAAPICCATEGSAGLPRPQPGPESGRRRDAQTRGSRNARERQPHHPRRRRQPRPSRSTSSSGEVRPGDLFLLASDGLTRVVRDARSPRSFSAARRTRRRTG